METLTESRLNGCTAGRDLRYGDHMVDLSPGNSKHVRLVAEPIPKGAPLEVRADGRVYAGQP